MNFSKFKWIKLFTEQVAIRTGFTVASAEAVPTDTIAFYCEPLQMLPRIGIWRHTHYLLRLHLLTPANFAGTDRVEEQKNLLDALLDAIEDIRKQWEASTIMVQDVNYEQSAIDISITFP